MKYSIDEYTEAKERLKKEQMPWEICELERIIRAYEGDDSEKQSILTKFLIYLSFNRKPFN